MSPPRVFIRYKVEEDVFVDFEEFYSSIEEIQWMDEKKPTSDDLEGQLAEAWNFLINEETIWGKERDDAPE
jgi:succinate dehydrogenase/fumarate reductase-like Fe-S protein